MPAQTFAPTPAGASRDPSPAADPPPPAPTTTELEVVEAGMYEDLYRAIPPRVAHDLGVSAEARPSGLFLRATGFDHPFFNRVMHPSRPDQALVDEAVEHYTLRGVRRWMIQVLPGRMGGLPVGASPVRNGVPPLVRLRGWSKHVGHVERVRGPGPAVLSPHGLRVVEVGHDPESEAALDWAGIVVRGFQMHPGFVSWMAALAARPDWRLYLALSPRREGSRPLAAAALYRPPSHPHLAQLNLAATLPEARGRGGQTLLLAHRREEARVRGVRWLVSESDEDLPDRPNSSHRNLVRLGLAVRHVRANVGPPPPQPR